VVLKLAVATHFWVRKLEELGHTVKLMAPQFVKDKKAVNKIEDTLTRLGYGASNISALVASNHWYTKDTIGLFIVPDGIVPIAVRTLRILPFNINQKSETT
jgi:hypothetical protein